MNRGINVLALVKDSERYIFLYDDRGANTLMQTLGRYAANSELSFTWYDAAVLSQRVRKLKQEVDEEASDWFGGRDDLPDDRDNIGDNNYEIDLESKANFYNEFLNDLGKLPG